MTKIFCEIANLKIIKKFNKKKIVKGFTTNPSLMRKAGARDYMEFSKRILKNRLFFVSGGILGGTTEIQKNIIAQRGLGLPR